MHASPMDWTEMPYFLAVARNGSLRLAAESLGVSHGTVDRHIQSLEVASKCQLFVRSPNGMVLTASGEALLPAAEQAETMIIGARNTLASIDTSASGRVRFAMPSWIAYPIIAPRIRRFRALYPDIDLEIMISNRFQSLQRAEADVSIRVAFDVEDGVVSKHLFVWHDAVIASEGYLKEHWGARGRDGQGLHWLGWAGPNPHHAWEKQRPFPKAKVVHAIEDEMMFLHMIEQGHGMAVFPVACTNLTPGLVRVPDTPVLPDRSLWLLTNKALQNTARVRAVVDFFEAELMALKAVFQGVGSPVFAN